MSSRNWDIPYNTTLWARWSANTYMVMLNHNGGWGETNMIMATFAAPMPPARMPSRPGYTFIGFYNTPAQHGGTRYYNADGTSARDWNIASDATLWARWTANNRYVVFLNHNGGWGETNLVFATYGAPMPIARMPMKLGYIFTGYYDTPETTGGTRFYNVDGSSARNWDIPSDTTLWARWERIPVILPPRVLGIGDIDGDGRTALLAIGLGDDSYGAIYVARSNGTGFGQWVRLSNPGKVSSYDTILFGNVTGHSNGQIDLVRRNAVTGRIEISRNDGGFFNSWTGEGPQVWDSNSTILLGNVAGDNNRDDLVVSTGTRVEVWNSDGINLSFFSSQNIAITGTIFLGDFNGNGRSDLLMRNANTGNVQIAYSNGSGFEFWSRQGPSWMASNSIILVGNVTGSDSRYDIVEINDWELYIYRNTGTFFQQIFAHHGLHCPYLRLQGFQYFLGDISGNGKADLIRVCINTSVVDVWKSDGTQFAFW